MVREKGRALRKVETIVEQRQTPSHSSLGSRDVGASRTSAGAPLRASTPELGSERALRVDGAQGVLCPEPDPRRMKAGHSAAPARVEHSSSQGAGGQRLALALGTTQWKLEGRVVPEMTSLLGSHCTQHE